MGLGSFFKKLFGGAKENVSETTGSVQEKAKDIFKDVKDAAEDAVENLKESTAEVAEKAAEACNVSITGVDIIIEDISTIASNRNYTILEMNFNPALHIHNYPYIGTNRDLGQKIIEALFPEIKS